MTSEKNDKRNMWIGIGAVGVCVAAIAGISSSGETPKIEIDDNFTFDCNAIYDETNNIIKCTDQEISGTYSAKDNIKLMSGDTELTTSDGNFSKMITAPTIPASEFETDTYVTTLILEKKYGETKEQFALLENGEQKLDKEVTIKWNITTDDKKLFDSKQDEWRERKKAEQKAATEATTTPASTINATPATTQSNSSSSTNSSPDSGVDDIVEGYCNDGTFVRGNPAAKGAANKCYGHDGWRDY